MKRAAGTDTSSPEVTTELTGPTSRYLRTFCRRVDDTCLANSHHIRRSEVTTSPREGSRPLQLV